MIFVALEKRISRKTEMPRIAKTIEYGHKPKIIATAGDPIEITSIPTEWPQEERFSYLPNQPVLYIFDAPGSKTGEKGDKACTLVELETWLKDERDNRRFWIGVLALGLLSMAIVFLRLTSVS